MHGTEISMKNKLLVALLCAFVLAAGCSNDKGREAVTYSSRTYGNIYVTNSLMDINSYAEILTYRLIIGDEASADNIPENKVYSIGEDAILIGENLEQFNGSEVQIKKIKSLKNLDDDDFVDEIFDTIVYEKMLDEENDKKEINRLKRLFTEEIDYLKDNATLYTINLCLNFRPNSDAVIKKLVIPEINFEFEYDNLNVIYDEDMDLKNGNQSEEISSSLYSSHLAYKFNPYTKSLYSFTIDPTTEIDKIELNFLDENFTLITSDNIDQYPEEKLELPGLFDGNRKYNIGEQIYEDIIFLIDENIGNNYESIYVPMLVTIHSGDKVYSEYLNSPNIVGWEWFLYSYISNVLR